MKNILKKIVLSSLCLVAVIGITGCTNDDDKLHVGILQYVTHDALDAAYSGIVSALNDAGYNDENMVIDLKNPQTDASSLSSMAKTIVRDSDIIFAIATPAAQAILAELENQAKETPMFFTAVTDAEVAGLVNSNEKPGGNITGTSDMNPVSDQIDLIKTLIPTASKVGIMYTSSEDNSRIQADLAKEAILNLGMEAVTKTVVDANQIQQVFNSLAIGSDKVDAIYIPTDNLLASQMALVHELSIDANLAVICGEESMVNKGGTATLGINYTNLGKLTGNMAIDYLKNNKSISEMAVQTLPVDDLSYVINKTVTDGLGINIPESLNDAMLVTME